MRARLLVFLLVIGCRKNAVEVRPDDKKSGPPRVTCTLAEPILEAKIPARCDLAIDKVIKVPAGSSLEIGAGARLTFAKGAGLILEGGVLRARGTAEEPIVFTSATRVAGDWSGITFAARPIERSPVWAKVDAGPDAAAIPPYGESVLEHVVVELAGGSEKRSAAVRVEPFPGDKVSLSHVTIKNPVGHALTIHHDSDVTRLEGVKVGDASVRVPLATLAMLAPDPSSAVFLHGSVNESTKLGKRAKPYVIEASLNVQSTKPPVTLEIESGAVLAFEKNARLSLSGYGAGVTLIAKGVTFTSAEATKSPGDWEGIGMSGDVATEIEGCTFEFAGGSSKSSRAVLRLPSTETKVHITGSTFRSNGAAAIETWNDCKPWEDPKLKNTSAGKPLCEEHPLAKTPSALSIASLGALGALGSTNSTISALSHAEIGTLDIAAAGPGYGGLGGGGGIGGLGGGGIAAAPKPSSKVVESSITATGGLPADVVRKIVRSQIGSLRSCHSGSDASGTITVSFTIADGGSVTTAKVSGGSLTDATVRSCVTKVFLGMNFPPAEGAGSTTATATHDYS